MAKGLPSVVEVLKKQLTLSDSTIRDLRGEIRSLQSTVERLSQENCELRSMIQVKYYFLIFLIFFFEPFLNTKSTFVYLDAS